MANKILYIGNDILDVNCGADAVNKMNIGCLRSIFSDDLIIMPLTQNSILDKFRRYVGGVNSLIEEKILQILSLGGFQYVFLSNSLMGRVAKKIKDKFPNIQIVVFYHNIETYYAKELIKTHGIKHYFFYYNALFNETLASRFSDVRISLNLRDSNLLEKFYKVKANEIIPVSYKDNFDSMKVIKDFPDGHTYLFVGTSFFANIEGIRWFIKKIMPNVHGKLIIVGNGMENFKSEFSSDRTIVHGYVDNLADYYYGSSFVIAPIFVGGGMKTKIAEAVMYGKTVIGTKEAFEGYFPNNNVLLECNTEDEFINKINQIENNKLMYNFDARKYFLDYYSEQGTLRKFHEIFKKSDHL